MVVVVVVVIFIVSLSSSLCGVAEALLSLKISPIDDKLAKRDSGVTKMGKEMEKEKLMAGQD